HLAPEGGLEIGLPAGRQAEEEKVGEVREALAPGGVQSPGIEVQGKGGERETGDRRTGFQAWTELPLFVPDQEGRGSRGLRRPALRAPGDGVAAEPVGARP